MNRVFAAACAAACLAFSAAHAEGAFVLDDASLDKVTAGGFVSFNVSIFKEVEVDPDGAKTVTIDALGRRHSHTFLRPRPMPM